MLGKVKTPALERLEKQFQEAGGEWKEFRIGELFEIKSSKKIFHANEIKIFKHRVQGSYPYIVRSTANNGVRGYFIGEKDHLNPKNTLSFAQDTFSVFYQEDYYFTGNKIKVLIPKKWELNKNNAMFFVSACQKTLLDFTWGKNSTVSDIYQIKIRLPINADNCIDFNFIEKYTKELEWQSMNEYKKYLQKLKMEDPRWTQGKNNTIEFKNEEKVRWKEFKVRDLFYVKSNPQLNKESFVFREDGEYPYFTRTCLNNGINGYVEYLDEEHKIQGNALAVGMLGMQFFYMQKDFYAGQFTKTIYPRNFLLNPRLGLYFATLLNKHSQSLLGVLVRDFEKTFLNKTIKLPVDSKNKIDFKYMESMIEVLQKQSLARVDAHYKEKL